MADKQVGTQTRLKAGREHEALLAGVGVAISTWASAESMLIRVCARLLGAQEVKTGIVLYSVMDFNIRLAVIAELFEFAPDYKPHKGKWNKICKRLRQLNDTRVRVAHHTVLPYAAETELPKGLRPAVFDQRAKSKKYAPLTIREMVRFSGEVMSVWSDLIILCREMDESVPRPNSP